MRSEHYANEALALAAVKQAPSWQRPAPSRIPTRRPWWHRLFGG